MLSRLALLLVASITIALSAACGDDSIVADAGIDGAADGGDAGLDGAEGVSPPIAPAEAATPVLGPCASGFRAFTNEDGVELCDPWPAGGRPVCPAGEAAFPGAAGCAPVGTACPADGLPAVIAGEARTWWVLADAGAGGAGTRDDPMSTVAEATAAAAAGDVIAIGRGDYVENVAVPRGVTLRGACVREVTIRGPASRSLPVVTAGGADGTLSNLTVTGSDASTGILVGAGASLTAVDVIIEGTRGGGVSAENGGTASLRRSVIESLIAVDGRAPGITARTGATVDGDELVIDGSVLAGVFVGGRGTSVTLARTLIAATAQGTAPGVGLVVSAEASLEVSTSAIEANHGAGGIVSGTGTRFTLEDSVIRDNLPDSTNRFGRGLNMETGAEGILRRTLVFGNRDVGLYVNAGATLALEDTVVSGTESESFDQLGGHGVEVHRGSSVTASRVMLADNRQTGAFVDGASSLSATDLVVSRTRGQAFDGKFGIGLQLQSGATAELDRVRLSDNRHVGMTIFVAGPVGIRDLTIERTASNEIGRFGRGLDVEDATATVERALFVENHDISLFAATNTQLDVTDLTIRDTQPEEGYGTGGRGLNYQMGAEGTITRALIENSYEVGVGIAFGAGIVTMSDVVVRGVSPQACAATTCPGLDFGMGVLVANSPLRMGRFVVEDAALCGFQVAEEGQLDLENGTVRRNLIGACVQVDGYDIERLSMDVRYLDNGTNLESTMLPVPPPVLGVEL